ncbi:hypothetical protein KK101_16335 [Curtobacterium flaccumfaciens pv. oortii]|uniref:hypothetical protein n=1 Tax=Curtobacterium flaccumfaciens TaxID=2035 RepID=UPI001BDE6CCA|nr:hypothetical protein [Curtobacterium flaccumfaciens]MBT1624264.1 hypothetical protein [Curtobacterium flaccumfaciens pv. oortii]
MSLPKPRAFLRRTTQLVLVTLPAFGGRGVQFIALAVMALVVTPADYGRFATLQVLVLGLASITSSTMGASANATAARAARFGLHGVRPILSMLLAVRRRTLIVNALVSAVAIPAGYAIVVGAPADKLLALVAIGLLSAALPVGETVVAVVAGTGWYRTASWIDAGRAVVGAGLALLLGVFAGPWWATVGLLSADVALALIAVVVAATSRHGAVVESSHGARDGLVAGITANVLGQVANWVVLWAVGAVGGAVGLGVYGVALRFASVVTLAPQYFGKTVIGQLAAPDPTKNHWTPRSFVGMLAVLSVMGSAVAVGVLVIAFPALLDRYEGLMGMMVGVLVATSFRAVLIGLGHVCVARRRWRTWVLADATSLLVTVVGVLVALAGPSGVPGATTVVLASAVANLAGIATRLRGLSRPASTPNGLA